jgi:HlyD family secretion protein
MADRRLVLAGIAAGLLGLWWLTRGPGLPVVAAEVGEGPLSMRVVTNGSVEPVEEAVLRARLAGRILEIPEPGAEVSEGDVVVRFDDGPVASEISKARSERLAAEESLREARSRYVRVRERAKTDRQLFEQGAITKSRWAVTQADLRDARERVGYLEQDVPLRIDSLDLRIQDLEAQLEAAVVRAPVSGSVYRTARRKGELAGVGDPLLWIADLGRLRVRANIDQVDLGRVAKGQLVRITSNAFAERSWSGRMTEVIPLVVVKQSRTVSEALAQVEPPTDGLVPGMTVDVEVIVAETAQALQVPAEAVFAARSEPFVFRILRGRARRTPVRLGLETVTAVQVLEGVEPGDRVVLGPARGLGDGDRVEVQLRNGRP